ncbi:MAG: hypothetical protein HIU57_04840 [Acidobacteria bacterium]|nr:hypothetical protein [Acidobacteriota bacterium]
MRRTLSFWASKRSDERRADSERGAVLVLALIFVVAVGLIATALATWATNDLNNAKTFTNVEALHSDATGMMKMSIQYVRYHPVISTSQAVNVASPAVACWGGNDPTTLPVIDSNQVAVWCTTVWNPGLATTRVVTFYACDRHVPVSVCTAPGKSLLTEVVTFDDYYPGQLNAPNQTLCSATCGQGMTVESSTWGVALVDAQANVPSRALFIVEPSSTIVNASTTAQVKVLDSGGLALSGERVMLSVQGPGSLSSASTMSAVTNVAGVADFNGIIPATAGTLILQATAGAVSTTSTGFVVGKGANSITVLASNPGDTPVGSVISLSPSPSATATSGQPVVVSGTPGICTTSGDNQSGDHVSVTALAGGTCVLTFADPGNADYVAATPVPMRFNVASPHPVALAITATASTPASRTTNDMLTVTLLDQSGKPTASNGTTVVSLSQTIASGQNGSGYFADAVNAKSNETSVTFLPNHQVAYAYFGDTNAESVTVSASLTGLQSATTGIQVTATTPSQVVVTAAPSPALANDHSNVRVAIAIEDQFSNVVTLASPTAVSLSATLDGSSTGFFTQDANSPTPMATNVIVLPAGLGSSTVYFGDTVATPSGVHIVLGASAVGFSGTATVTIDPLGPAQVAMVWSSTTISASDITNTGFVVQLQDKFGNVTAPTGSTTYKYRLRTDATYSHAVFADSSNAQRGWGGSARKTWDITLSSNWPDQQLYFGDNQHNVTPTVFVEPVDGGSFSTSQRITVN